MVTIRKEKFAVILASAMSQSHSGHMRGMCAVPIKTLSYKSLKVKFFAFFRQSLERQALYVACD